MDSSIFYKNDKFEFTAKNGAGTKGDTSLGDMSIENVSVSNNESFTSNAIEKLNANDLTWNDNYKVSKLNGFPSELRQDVDLSLTNAHFDHYTKRVCVAVSNCIYIWQYDSIDTDPITSKIIQERDNNLLFPVLVLPQPGNSEPGLVVINSGTGSVFYYESVASDPSVSISVTSGQIESVTGKISLGHGERITLVECAEPVGVVVATSEGRVILVTLRDHAGKPALRFSNVVSNGLIPFFKIKRRVSSMRVGKDLGMSQMVKTLNIVSDDGTFSLYSISRDGQVSKLYESSIADQLAYEIKQMYDTDKIEILDCHSLFTKSDTTNEIDESEIFLILCAVSISVQETYYVLFTFEKNAFGEMLCFSGYRLIRYTIPYNSQRKPIIVLPEPHKTAFVVFSDAIVLTDVVSKLDHSLIDSRKWEDFVSFRNGVHLLGVGSDNYELKRAVSSIYVVTKEAGVVRVEKSISGPDSANSFTKSHIEQAVFFGYNESNPLSFSVPESVLIDNAEIELAIMDVSNELLSSKSSYLPPKLASMSKHLELRLQKMSYLVDYVAENFLNEMSLDTKMRVKSDLQKIRAAYNIWPVFEEAYNTNNQDLLELFRECMDSGIEHFFYYEVGNIDLFLSKIIGKLLSSSTNYSVAVLLVLKCVKEGAIDIETEVQQNLFKLTKNDVGSFPSWIINHDLCFQYDTLFDSYLESVKDLAGTAKNSEISHYLISLVSILFFSFTYGLSYYTSNPLTKAIRDTIQRYKSVYEVKKGAWIKSLVLFGEMEAALQLAESFEDLYSLVEIVDNERERAIRESLDTSIVNQRFNKYFELFGYRFAEALYNYYIINGKLQELFLGFPQHREYLRKFLKSSGGTGSSNSSTARISWIRCLLDDEFFEGGYTLYNVANKADDLITNKRLQLSIAKLSLCADDSGNPNTNDLLLDIENGLTIIDLQIFLFNEVVKYRESKKKSDVPNEIDRILSSLTENLKKRAPSLLFSGLRKPLTKLLLNKSVSVNELVDLFTLLDVKSENMKLDYYKALKLVGTGLLPYTERKISESLIWRRAILSDNWADIIKSAKVKSPEYVRNQIEQSILYTTLFYSFQEELFTNNVNLPTIASICEEFQTEDLALKFKGLTQKNLVSLNDELKKEIVIIQDLVQNWNFEETLKTVIGTAKENSGSKSVLNYRTLQIN